MASVHVRRIQLISIAGLHLVRPFHWPGLILSGHIDWPDYWLRVEPLVLMPYLSIVLRAMRCDANAVRCDVVRCEYG